ncbi:DUF3108 domain-containing protein [Gammaproteobacteria bacterium]|nr:DUF3108 domain-containing protein [Gammaproteobacteria bacterium]MDA9834882.1 DUF3108 domain-containing protein [Gammaproteobacteria bacterium]MDA9979031.1 DUF3108 domain-containing protein [Gammaproteobacteria bacterium]MDC3372218.1 DUF3108 domain-containing protein [Gammaproteobacteria bacterium]
MYRSMSVLLALIITLNVSGQIVPDYRAIYDFTNSDVSMEGVRELKTLKDGKRSLSFNAKFPLGKINIVSDFHESEDFISTNQYTVSAKWTIVKQERVLKFDRAEKTISASGKFEWVKDLPDNLEIFDPLNAQIQIRKKVMQGAQTFSLLLPEIKTGEIESNQYKLNPDADCLVGEKIYQCKVVQRERPQENRTTTYFLSPELGYLIVKIEDQDSKGDTLLELKSIL